MNDDIDELRRLIRKLKNENDDLKDEAESKNETIPKLVASLKLEAERRIYLETELKRQDARLIPVQDRLPDDEDIKLVYNANQEWKGGIAEWNFAWYDAIQNEWVIRSEDGWKQESITHWSNLPKIGSK